MGRPKSGKSAPKNRRPSLIDRFTPGGSYEAPAPVIPASHVKPTGETVSASPQMKPVTAPAPVKKVAPARPTQTRPAKQKGGVWADLDAKIKAAAAKNAGKVAKEEE